MFLASTATKLDIEGTQFSTKIIEGGWKLNDSLLQCEFRGHTCDESVSEINTKL